MWIIICQSHFTEKTVLSDIEDNFDILCKSISDACITLKEMGFSEDVLFSNYPITVLAYRLYKMKKTLSHEERNEVKMFVIKSSWVGLFGGSTDGTLENTRKSMQQNNYIIGCDDFKIYITEESIRDEVDYSIYPRHKKFLFQMLFLLYPSFDFRNNFHLDHIYPQYLFNKKQLKKVFPEITDTKIDDLWQKCNTVANLQLLKSNGSIFNNLNKSSSMPEDWIDKEFNSNKDEIKQFKRDNIISEDIKLTLDNFEKFIEYRASKITAKLIQCLITK